MSQQAGAEEGCARRMAQKLNLFQERQFRKYGNFVTSGKAIYMVLVALVLAGILAAGVTKSERETKIEEIWVNRGTRLIEEKEFFESKFGGLPRKQLPVVSRTDGSNAFTKLGLNAMLSVLNGVTNNANPNLLTLDTDIGNGANGTRTVDQELFCERPEVASVFKPQLPGVNYLASGRIFSHAYQSVAQCMFPSTNPLPTGWGIDRLPCTRATSLDCFQEGAFDYPVNMGLLQTVSPLVFTNPNGNRSTCVEAWKNQTAGILTAIGHPAPVPFATSLATRLETAIIPLFFSWGYWYRPSINSFATDADLLAYYSQAIKNNVDDSVTLNMCLGGAPCCNNWSGIKVDQGIVAGGLEKNAAGNLTKVTAIRSVINNYNEDHPTFIDKLTAQYPGIDSTGEREDLVKGWESSIRDLWLNFWSRQAGSNFEASAPFGDYNFDFLVWRSTNDTVEEGSKGEADLILWAYVAMILYAILPFLDISTPLSKRNVVYSHSLLVFSGILAIALSTFAGFGLTAWLGIKYSPVSVTVVPILSLGLGCDDMFVLLHALDHHVRHTKADQIRERMQLTLEAAGPSVVVTSISNFAAFMVAAATPIDAVTFFTIQMGLTVLLNLIFLLLMFVPFMVWDQYRIAAGRADIIPVKILSPEEEACLREGRDQDGYAHRFVKNVYAPLLRMPLIKGLVLFLFTAYFGAMIYTGFFETELGVRLQDVAVKGSYQRDGALIIADNFKLFDAFIVTKDIDYADPARQQELLDIQVELQQSTWLSETFAIRRTSWLADGTSSILYTANNTHPTTTIPSAAFYPTFREWITGSGSTTSPDLSCAHAVTGERVSCSTPDGNTTIVATKQTIYLEDIGEADDAVDAIKDTRDRTDGSRGESQSYVYGFTYQYNEQYLHIRQNLYILVGLALLGVAVISFFFMASIQLTALIVLVILMITVEMYGMMNFINVKLNAFSLANLAVAVGIAVEFTAHIARAFAVAQGPSRDHRVQVALLEMAMPMFAGAMTSFVAVFVLIFAEFPFFRDYFFATYSTMIAIAFLNGLVFLPVLLSICGPPPLDVIDPDEVVDDDSLMGVHPSHHSDSNVKKEADVLVNRDRRGSRDRRISGKVAPLVAPAKLPPVNLRGASQSPDAGQNADENV